MALQKFTVYVCASINDYNFGRVQILSFDPTGVPYTKAALISTHEIELDVPAFDIRDQAIVVLEKEIQKERADSQAKINLLLEQISNFRAIGHDGGEV